MRSPERNGHTDDGTRPEPAGRSWARYGLAVAMIATVGALLAVSVPSSGDQIQTVAADATPTSGSGPADPVGGALAYGALPATLVPENAPAPDTAPGGAPDPAPGAAPGTGDGSGAAVASGNGPPGGAAAPGMTAAGSTAANTAPASAAGSPAAGASVATTARPAAAQGPATTTAPTTRATTAPTTAATTPGGGCWKLVTQDDFNGSSLDTSMWSPYNSSGNAGHGLRRSSAISVSGGLLTMTAQMVNSSLVSGGMANKLSQTYGRYETRVRTDQDPSQTMSGLVLTWPQSDNQPRDGENDIYETTGTPGDRHQFNTFIHKPGGSPSDQEYVIHQANASDWHTIAMDWSASQIKLYRDGSLVKTIDETSANKIPDNPHHVAIQLDAWGDNLPGRVTLQVDYIRIYAPC